MASPTAQEFIDAMKKLDAQPVEEPRYILVPESAYWAAKKKYGPHYMPEYRVVGRENGGVMLERLND